MIKRLLFETLEPSSFWDKEKEIQFSRKISLAVFVEAVGEKTDAVVTEKHEFKYPDESTFFSLFDFSFDQEFPGVRKVKEKEKSQPLLDTILIETFRGEFKLVYTIRCENVWKSGVDIKVVFGILGQKKDECKEGNELLSF